MSKWLNSFGAVLQDQLLNGLIDKGRYYGASSGDLSLAVGTDVVAVIRISSEYNLRIELSILNTGDMAVYLLEAPGIVSSGNSLDITNYNRVNPGAIHTTFYGALLAASSILTSTTAPIFGQFVPSSVGMYGKGPTGIGLGVNWLLNSDNVYAFKVEPLGVGTCNIAFQGYEVDK